MLAALAFAAPSQAQTSEKLVGNTGQAVSSGHSSNKDRAQGFRTGDNAAGYRLTSVKVEGNSAPLTIGSNTMTAKLFRANASGHPTGASLGTFANPTGTADLRTFTAPGNGIVLDPNQGYVFVMDIDLLCHSGCFNVDGTASDGEDSGAASGWSIANDALWGNLSTNTWANATSSIAMQIEVHGYALKEPSRVGRTNMSLRQGGTACSTCPATPTGHAQPGPGPGEITVRWVPGVDTRATPVSVKAWKVYRGNTDFTGLASGNASNATRSWVFSGLVPGQEYGVAVGAVDTSDAVGTIIGGIVRAGAAPPPEAPSAPTATAVTGKGGHLSVSWTAPDGNGATVTDYDLRYFAGSTDPTNASDWVEDGEATGLPALSQDTSVSPPTAAPTSGTITGLKPSTAYRVQVRAANSSGESPWSASGSGTTNAASGSNNAPIVVVQAALDPETNIRCTAHSATTPSFTHHSPANSLVSTVLTVNNRSDWPQYCVGNSDATRPIFHDPDNEDLSISVAVTFPDNVRSMHRPGAAAYPLVQHYTAGGESGWRLFNRVAAAGSRTDLPVTVTATDPQGASKSVTYTFQAGTFPPKVGAPSFNGSVGVLEFVQNMKGSAVLPPAIGGDTQNGGIPHYLYKVTGLPPGLSFDEETRTVSGTPTTAGTSTATYIADDYDGQYSQKASPTAADTADAARQTFTVRVARATGRASAGAPIGEVRIVSRPTHDADSDGTFDTYIQGNEILVDVEYGEAVEIVGDHDNVRLRLDLGSDDTDLANSRKVMKLKQVLNGGRTLRFAYTVADGDADTDGVWLQTVNLTSNFTVMFWANDAKVRSVATGEDVSRLKTGLPTAGDARHKVDGSRTTVAGPVPDPDVPATINGKTLTVTFDKALSTNVDTAQLMYHLSIQGAGDVSGGNRSADQHPDRISIGGKVLTLGLYEAVGASDVVTLSHSGDGLLKGADNEPAPGFRDLPVTNVTAGSVGPLPQRASVAGRSLKVVFDVALDASSLPAGNAFRVLTQDFDGDRRDIGGAGTVSIQGTTVTVGLAAAVRPDELASVSYAPPASGSKLQDATYATAVKAFSGFRVETVDDATGPTLIGAAYIDHPTVTTGSSWTLYFDEALDTTSVPAAADFEVRVTGDSGQIASIANLAVANNAITFVAAARPPTMWIKYTPPATGGIRDLAGNPAAKIDGETWDKVGGGKPGIVTAGFEVDGALLSIHSNVGTPMDPTSTPATSAFTLHDTDSGSTQLSTGVEAVLVQRSTVLLRLAHPVLPCAGQTPIRVKYTKPTGAGDAKLRGVNGNAASEVDTFGPYNVTNERHTKCRDGRNWLSHMTIGSVVIRANRPFATDKAPKPEWFSVTASGGPVTVTGAAFDPNDAHVLKLTLSREFAAGETVTASYRRPAGESGLWDVDGYQLGDVADWPVRAKAQAAQPTLSVADASADEGGTLSFAVTLDAASASAATVDWATSDGTATAGEDYESASGTLTFAAGETEKTVSVQTLADAATEGDEAFTLTLSNASGAELADSEATGTVTDVPPPLTAEFRGLPSGHDGSRRFAFEIVFSEEFEGLRLTAFQAGALEVANGRLIDAKRTVRGENRSVTLRARPDSDGPVTLTLKATTDCAAADAICASDGRPLSAAVSATVAGPGSALPALSVADASGAEGGTLSFAVTLDAASDTDATVDWATSDGTATAGADYTAASGTLTFTAGETSKTVNVAALHDAEAETDETFTLTLSNTLGATLGDATATGTVTEVAPLTASLANVPAEHDGTNAFSFELAFSDDFPGALDGATLAGAFTVGNGTATGAARIVAGQNRRWTVTVQPSSTGAVTLSLAAGAVTTEAGRPLANAVSATVAAPALLSVADAEADEGKALSFAVTLDRAASGTVTVDWATADGTATAGTDYTSASGTLTFSAGETAKTVAVQALSDASVEGDETFSLNLSNASRAAIADGAATGTVIDVPPLTASFANLPAEHDGSHRFGFEIVFSEEFDGMRLTAFAAGALQVAGGRLIDAKRAVRGQNRRVAVRVRPDSNEDLTLTLASGADCNAAHAICANDGRMLSNTVTATVRGPALLSVADVDATEGEDENVLFTVSLNRAAGTATVDYATADRTAHAGEDYTATSGTLAFAPGETSKTVAVPLLDDAIDDDGETFALELNNAQGAALGDRVGLATIRNSDPVPKAWLVRFSRATTDHAVDAVQRRFDDRAPEPHATLGGHRLWGPGSLFNRPAGRSEGILPSSGGEGILPSQAPEGRHAPHGSPRGTLAGGQPLWREGILPSQAPKGRHARHGGSPASLWTEGLPPSTRRAGIPHSTGREGTLPSSGGEGILPSQAPEGRHAPHGGSPGSLWTEGLPSNAPAGRGTAFGAPTLHDLLQGSSFLLSLSAEEEAATPRRLTTWGNAATTRFDGLDGNVSVDGEVATYLLGADLEWNRWLAGVALAHSVGHGGFQAGTPGHKSGQLDSSLTAMHPYLRWRASDRVSAWGMLGYGTGTLALVVDETKPGWTTDTSMRMAAAGMRGVLSRSSGMELAAKLDARLSHIASDAAESASGLLGDTAGGTSRLRLALEGSRTFAIGTSRMLTPTLDLGLRHDGGDAETGAGVDLGGTLRYADAHLGLTAEASGRWLLAHEDAAYREWGASATVRVDPGTANCGLSLSLQPSWGATATGGADRLWSLQDARGLASGGYGMDEGMRLDADVGWTFDWFRGKGAMRPFLGMRTAGPSRDWRAGVAWHRGQHLEFGFEASRRDSPAQPPDHGIELRLEWRPAQGTAFRAVPHTPESPPSTPDEATEAPPQG